MDIEMLKASGFVETTYPGQEGVFLVKRMPVSEMPYAHEHIVDDELVSDTDTGVIEVFGWDGPAGFAGARVQWSIEDTDYYEEPVQCFSEEGRGLLRDAGVPCSQPDLATNSLDKDSQVTDFAAPLKTLVSNDLLLYFSVGRAGPENDETNADRHQQSFETLDKRLHQQGLDLFGVTFPAEFGEERYKELPFDLCEAEWEQQEADGRAVYHVCFQAARPFEKATAAKLRDFVAEAYQSVCGTDAQFVRAELYQKWEVSESSAFDIDA